MNFDDATEEIGAELKLIGGLRVYPYAADRVTPPAAVLGWPEVTYDETMRRGMDRYDLPLWIIVGKASDRAAKKNIAPYLAGDGPKSIKAVLEAKTDAKGWLSFDTLRVTSASPVEYDNGAVVFLAYHLPLDIAGQGAA